MCGLRAQMYARARCIMLANGLLPSFSSSIVGALWPRRRNDDGHWRGHGRMVIVFLHRLSAGTVREEKFIQCLPGPLSELCVQRKGKKENGIDGGGRQSRLWGLSAAQPHWKISTEVGRVRVTAAGTESAFPLGLLSTTNSLSRQPPTQSHA